ncbi:glutathione S-transferase [Pseudomethylobacillus aquaticus]|uniref:Glutathione S-transferase n=1 Tax=Pseudomethylobacillus aquaticus TaxID=2676064 RepID=A0A3N0UVJ0_9PROT|nr:glutathione S-transferase [Pseudomethylobacillus aquaticus]
MRPVLYSYRRCPYAMRARMALYVSGTQVEVREIALRDKPAELLAASPKATVPVLVLEDGTVIDQSRSIMAWALRQADPQGWLKAASSGDLQRADALVDENDTDFKRALDGYKYPQRHPGPSAQEQRAAGEQFLHKLELRLQSHAQLLGNTASWADVAVFPFVRQFAMVDTAWFSEAPYPQLRGWLTGWLQSALFEHIMVKLPTWQAGQPASLLIPPADH